MNNFVKSSLSVLIVLQGASIVLGQDPEAFAKNSDDFFRAFPPEIKTVAVVSPASSPAKKTMENAMNILRKNGIKVKAGKHLYAEPGKQSGKTQPSIIPLEQRKEDLMNAWMDPEVDLIICTRGGTGAQDLIKVLDWKQMAKFPEKKLIGYSNITCLTGAMLRKKIGHPFAGPNLGSLYGATPDAKETFFLAMSGKDQKPFKLNAIRSGDCKGGIYAGHMKLLRVLTEIPEFKFNPAGRIIFVECVRVKPDGLRKLWKTLVDDGFFKEAAGIVFCHFTGTGLKSEEINDLFREFAEDVSCPVYSGFPYGHLPRNYTLDLFGNAEIRNGVLTITPGKKK